MPAKHFAKVPRSLPSPTYNKDLSAQIKLMISNSPQPTFFGFDYLHSRMWQTCKGTKRRGDRAGERGRGAEVAGKVRAPIHQVTKQTVSGLMGPAHRQIVYSVGDNPREMRVLREASVYLDFPSKQPPSPTASLASSGRLSAQLF